MTERPYIRSVRQKVSAMQCFLKASTSFGPMRANPCVSVEEPPAHRAAAGSQKSRGEDRPRQIFLSAAVETDESREGAPRNARNIFGIITPLRTWNTEERPGNKHFRIIKNKICARQAGKMLRELEEINT